MAFFKSLYLSAHKSLYDLTSSLDNLIHPKKSSLEQVIFVLHKSSILFQQYLTAIDLVSLQRVSRSFSTSLKESAKATLKIQQIAAYYLHTTQLLTFNGQTTIEEKYKRIKVAIADAKKAIESGIDPIPVINALEPSKKYMIENLKGFDKIYYEHLLGKIAQLEIKYNFVEAKKTIDSLKDDNLYCLLMAKYIVKEANVNFDSSIQNLASLKQYLLKNYLEKCHVKDYFLCSLLKIIEVESIVDPASAEQRIKEFDPKQEVIFYSYARIALMEVYVKSNDLELLEKQLNEMEYVPARVEAYCLLAQAIFFKSDEMATAYLEYAWNSYHELELSENDTLLNFLCLVSLCRAESVICKEKSQCTLSSLVDAHACLKKKTLKDKRHKKSGYVDIGLLFRSKLHEHLLQRTLPFYIELCKQSSLFSNKDYMHELEDVT